MVDSNESLTSARAAVIKIAMTNRHALAFTPKATRAAIVLRQKVIGRFFDNTGVGFRQIVEKMHRTASTAEWFKEHGRHPVYAKNQDLDLPGGDLTVIAREKKRLPLVD